MKRKQRQRQVVDQESTTSKVLALHFSVDDIEEIVELFGDDAEEKTTISASVEENDDEFDEIATLPSSSKGKVSSTELCILKRDFQRTKDELAKVANSNRAL
ncbi:unnamed protein product [Prunus armeniaca]